MPKSQKKSKQLQDEELKAIAEGGLNDLVKNFSLRNKFARWVSVATTIAGISISMTMPVQAEVKSSKCEGDHDTDDIVIVQTVDEPKEDGGDGSDGTGERKCFEGAGEQDVFITDVKALYARENDGHVVTNKGTFQFSENEQINFNVAAGGTVVITSISKD